MPRRTKKPWNADLPLPPWAEGGKPHVPKPAPDTVTVGHSTPGSPRFECLRCARLQLGRDVSGLDHIQSCPWRGKGDPSVG